MSPLSEKEIDQLAKGYGHNFQPDVEGGLAKVRMRMDAKGSQAVVRPLIRRRWLAIAAAGLLLVSAGFFGLVYNPDTVYVNNAAEPLEVSLPDGTQIVLQQGATLAYASDFNETERRVNLEGQAFFSVAKDAKRPFLLTNGSTQLRVTGTEFNLRVEGEELEVEVSEGSVELTAAQERLAVKANQCGRFVPGKSLTLMEAPHLNRHAWRTGKLHFNDAELLVVLEALRTNFGLEVRAPEGCNYPVTGTFPGTDPVGILRAVALLDGGSVSGQGNVYQLVDVCK